MNPIGSRDDERLILITHQELAEMLRVSPKRLSNMIWAGELDIPAIQRGRKKLWRLADVRQSQYLNPDRTADKAAA